MKTGPLVLTINVIPTLTGHLPFKAFITTTPLERALILKGVITENDLTAQYKLAIERGECTTYGLAR